MNTHFLNYLRPALAGALLAALAACGGGGGSDASSDAGNGTLRLALTDAPACGFDRVNVTVEKVRVHLSSSAADADGGWSEVVLNPARRIDLLSLTNGALFELGQTPLAAGKYTQLRLVLADNTQAMPLANSVLPTGETTELALKTPSAQQSGLKIPVNITVVANQLADFVLDFDACKSVDVVTPGKSGNYNLKPVLRLIPRLISGVAGFVDGSLANGNTTVALQQAGVTLRSTVPDSTGKFLLQPVEPGSYTLVLTAFGRSTAVVNSVPVVTNTISSINTATTPLNPASSPTGTLKGTVTTGASPIDAMVRTLQTLTGGSKIEIVSRPVNSSTGAYSYIVPTAAPQAASYGDPGTLAVDAATIRHGYTPGVNYVAGAGTLVFSQAGAAGKYTLEAASGGVVKTSPEQTVTADTITTAPTFTFP